MGKDWKSQSCGVGNALVFRWPFLGGIQLMNICSRHFVPTLFFCHWPSTLKCMNHNVFREKMGAFFLERGWKFKLCNTGKPIKGQPSRLGSLSYTRAWMEGTPTLDPTHESGFTVDRCLGISRHGSIISGVGEGVGGGGVGGGEGWPTFISIKLGLIFMSFKCKLSGSGWFTAATPWTNKRGKNDCLFMRHIG